jgi:tripartite ATP-independent transporter DctM subunit
VAAFHPNPNLTGRSNMPLNEILALSCIASFFVLLALGIPVALTLAISGFFFGWIGFGPLLFNLLPARIFGVTANYTLIAIPLFVFMGMMLEKSRIADELMEVIGHLSGGLRGGMGIGIVLVGVLMGATTGIVGATIVTLGLLTLPTLLRRGYDKSIACGTICASGTLGQIIPPSTLIILLADILGQSVGTLFAAALIPGMMLAGIFCIFLLLLGMFKPELVPPIPQEERFAMSRQDLLRKVLKVGLPPIALVLAVLGSIIGGIAAPTEAASMGALGSIVVAGIAGRLNWNMLKETVYATGRITASMMFILICAQVFALAFRGLQGEQLVHDFFKLVPGGIEGVLWFMMILIFILGFFIEWIEISYIVVPLFLPVLQAANVDLVWVATLIALNMQTSFLTPPFGWALFYLRGVAPPQVTTMDIYKGVVPFIALQILAVVILFCTPGIATWLPRAIGW